MPSACSSRAASRWSGVSSALAAPRRRARRRGRSASWVLIVQRSGSIGHRLPPPSSRVRGSSASGRRRRTARAAGDSGTRSRRYWRWVRRHRLAGLRPASAPAPRAAGPPRPRARRTRRTPSRLSPVDGQLLDVAQALEVALGEAAAAAARSATGRADPCARRCAGSAGAPRPARPPPRSRRRPRRVARRSARQPSSSLPSASRGGGSVDLGQRLDRRPLLVGQLGRAPPPRPSPAGPRLAVASDRRARPGPCTRKVWPDGVPAAPQGDLAVERRHGERRAERRLGEGDRHGEGQVAPAAAEDRVPAPRGRRRRGRRRAPMPCPARAAALDPDALAVLHPGRDAHLDRAAAVLDARCPWQVGHGRVDDACRGPLHCGQTG